MGFVAAVVDLLARMNEESGQVGLQRLVTLSVVTAIFESFWIRVCDVLLCRCQLKLRGRRVRKLRDLYCGFSEPF